MIVDAHLDLAFNGLRGRDLTRPASRQVADTDGTPAVGLPDLRAAGVVLVGASVFADPLADDAPTGYRTPAEAHAMGIANLDYYRRLETGGQVRIVRARPDLPGATISAITEDQPLPILLAMEGADPILGPDDVAPWWKLGLRMVGLAWMLGTRYAGGNAAPGPLTDAGRALVPALDRAGIIHDAAHLAEEAFWGLLDLTAGPLCATHANPRAVVPGERQLSDAMLRAVAARGGVVGTSLYRPHLVPESEGPRRATIADVVRCVRHAADTLGSVDAIGLGTDADGGFGHEELPQGMRTHRDLGRVAEALVADGFGDGQVAAILGGNWLRFLADRLPAAA